jgi:uncharacterized membrane protein
MSRDAERPQQGQGPRGNNRRPNRQDAAPRKTIEVLPSPEVLESYDYVVEGSAARILEMFEREQMHRHAWEKRALRIHTVSTILGQVLGFLIALAIFISASVIGIYGDKTLGATIWVFGMSLVVMAALVWAYAKTLGQRPLFGRPTMRTHFRPQKEKAEE